MYYSETSHKKYQSFNQNKIIAIMVTYMLKDIGNLLNMIDVLKKSLTQVKFECFKEKMGIVKVLHG